MRKKIMAVVLTCALIMAMIPASLSGAATQSLFQDVNGHWGQEAIERFAKLGIVQGNQGRFNPDKEITRGELAIILDNIMNYQTMANNDLVDLGDAFYTKAVLKVNAAKVMLGHNKKFRPTENITREEAIVTISRAFGKTLAKAGGLTQFSDRLEVSSWAFEAINSMVSEKYINGYKGKLLPKSNITRVEIVTILDKVLKAMYSQNGEYTASVDGTTIISAKTVTLKNLTIKGDLIITEGVVDGEITLENVIVEGNTIVRGSGANLIIINNSKLTNMTVESNAMINNKGIISNVTVKANGVTILGDLPRKVVVNASVTVKPVDSRGNEVTPTEVTPETTTPPVIDPTDNKVPVIKRAEIIVKGEDDRWSYTQNGTPLLTFNIPNNDSVISHYSIQASKDGGEWKEIRQSYANNTTDAINLVDELDELKESGVYQFKIVSIAKNTKEYSNNEVVLLDTLKLTLSNEAIAPKVFTRGLDQQEIGIRQLKTGKLYQVYFFDNKGMQLSSSLVTTPKSGAIYLRRYDGLKGEMYREIKSIKIKENDATETTEGVDLVVSKLQDTAIPVEINNLPIDPMYPEIGEYLPTVINPSAIYNVDRAELNCVLKLPTDLSEFEGVYLYLFNSEGKYTNINRIYLGDSASKAELSGIQSEWAMIPVLFYQEKTVSFTKMGIISMPTEESVKLASITYVDTNITVNVAENPLTGYQASIVIDDSGASVVNVKGLESNKKYYINITDQTSFQGCTCISNSEGVVTMRNLNIEMLNESSKVYVQKYEEIADLNGYTLNVTLRGKDGVSLNLNGN